MNENGRKSSFFEKKKSLNAFPFFILSPNFACCQFSSFLTIVVVSISHDYKMIIKRILNIFSHWNKTWTWLYSSCHLFIVKKYKKRLQFRSICTQLLWCLFSTHASFLSSKPCILPKCVKHMSTFRSLEFLHVEVVEIGQILVGERYLFKSRWRGSRLCISNGHSPDCLLIVYL